MKELLSLQSLKRIVLLASCAGGLFLGATQTVVAHGTMTAPASRIWRCYQEGPQTPQSAGCQAISAAGGATSLYDWNGIRQGDANGNHQAKVPNGQLCSGGDPNYFKGQDLARSDWAATNISAGNYTFRWNNSAAHQTLYYRYYITNNGYNPTTSLRWSDLSVICETPPEGALNNPAHTCNIPSRSGRHVIYGVWQRSDSPEAFYSCSDVIFTGGPNSSVSSVSSSSGPSSSSGNVCTNLPTWSASSVYLVGNQVKLNNIRYQAQWWTQGDNPSAGTGSNYVWINQGSCGGGNPPSSSSSVASSIVSSSSVGSGNCTSAQFVQGATYATGAKVRNAGNEYQCTVGGWCTVGGPYEPGVGWAWTNAWTHLRSCH